MDRKAFATGLAWTMVVNLINKAVFPLVNIITSRLLGPGPLGAFAVVSTIMAVSEIFRDAGITQTYLADQDVDSRKYRSYSALAVIMAFVPAVVLILSKDWLAEVLELPELGSSLWVAAFALVANGFATMPRAQMLRHGKIKELAIIDLISGGTGIILTISLVLAKFAFWALVLQMVYCSVLTLWLSHRQAAIQPLLWDRQELGASFRKTGALLGANALNNLFLMADVFIIRRLLASNMLLGLYGQGKNIAYKPADFVTFPLTRMLIVAFSQSASDHPKLCRAVAKSLTATLMFVTPVYLLLIFAAEPIIFILLGPQFAGSAPVLAAMSVFLAFRTIGTIAGTAIVSSGRAKLTLLPQILCLLVTFGYLGFNSDRLRLREYNSVESYATARANGAPYKVLPGGELPNSVTGKPQPGFLIEYGTQPPKMAERVAIENGKVVPSANLGEWRKTHQPIEPFGLPRLLAIVHAFVLGALVLYLLSLVMALRLFPPPAEDRRKLFRAIGVSAITGLVITGINFMPLGQIAKLVLLLVLVPIGHLFLLGMSFAGQPLAYFSKAGLKRLWYEL